MPDHPLVSVIIPCYNQGRYLSESVDSALAQTYPHIEIIVVNDGSTDDTRQVAEKYGNRIIYIEKQNGGPSAARNMGAYQAKGEWLQFLDADDIIDPDKLEVKIAAAVSPKIGCIYSGWREVDEYGRTLRMVKDNCPQLPPDTIYFFLRGNNFPPSTILIRKTAFESAGGFDEGLKGIEDWDLFFRIALGNWQFISVKGHYSTHRLHSSNLSGGSKLMLEQTLLLLKKMEALVQADIDRVQIVKNTGAHTYLMLSYTHFSFQNVQQSQHSAKMALSQKNNIFPTCTGLWTEPLTDINLNMSEVNSRLQCCDRWVQHIILPNIQNKGQKSYFWADYRLWVIQSLWRHGFTAEARKHMLFMLASQNGILRICENQKSFAVKILFGERITDMIIRKLFLLRYGR